MHKQYYNWDYEYVECPDCFGRGWHKNENDECTTCKGKGEVIIMSYR